MIFGRTHRDVEPVWYRPVAGEPSAIVSELEALCKPGTVVDISSQPALWGGLLKGRGWDFMSRSPQEIEDAMNEKQAAELLEAHLIETLSAIGQPSIPYYALRVRKRWDESTLTGAISALELARQDGMVGCFGMWVDGPPDLVLGMWQFRDAFDFLVCHPSAYEVLRPLALSRRVGVALLSQKPVDGVQLKTIGAASFT